MLSEKLLEILVCPSCKGELEYNQSDAKLLCNSCRLKYRIEENIPIMLIEEAEKF
ncbi:MAG: Trm112 family protein [candidate division Zixibacteria bacterium]|nr:Trm112 family protein [candidate division Zixibacteria bacterium]